MLPRIIPLIALLALTMGFARAEAPAGRSFRAVAFYTGKEDKAHISFVHEANAWFPSMGPSHGFTYEATKDWTKLNSAFLAKVDVVLFLDTRPDDPGQRRAFQDYMEQGGAWMGFHFSAFALSPSKYPMNWDWYHHTFLGSGAYASNTWRPTAATLRVETRSHPAMAGLPATFRTAPNEWYRWENDLRLNPDIEILASIDPSSFPLGTGPKPSEIWHAGYYPVVWTNRHYRMIYMNMGHNDLDYEGHTNRQLSSTFGSEDQDRMILQGLVWLGRGGSVPVTRIPAR